MKVIRRIIAWSLLSIICQVSVLFILDRFVFRQSSEFASKKIELNKPYEDKINIKIPSNAENIKVSFNGRYMSYEKNDEVIITETKTGKEGNVKTQKGGQILYYEWLPERERIVIVEKIKQKGRNVLQLATYNPRNSETTYVTELCEYEKNMKVRSITESIFTNVYYVYISNGDTKDRCYRVDVNNEKFDVVFKCTNFGRMFVIPHTDRLVYDDLTNNVVYVTSPNKKLKFNTNNNIRLIGIDRNDVIYVGQEKDGKIFSIFYGKVDDDTSTWNNVNLDSPIVIDDIYFNSDSNIIVNDLLQGKVQNITTGKEYEYIGKFIDVKDNFIALNDAGKLVFKKFE